MVQFKIRCGEVYDFNMIKTITDNGNGTIEIVGNFKPRGRYKYVNLWKMSITNWNEVKDIFQIDLKPYFCTQCKRTHRDGAIFESHMQWMGNKEDLIPCDRIIKADVSKLRDLAVRQLNSLMKRLKFNPARADMYRHEINKLFIYEGVAEEQILPNQKQDS